MHTPSVSNTLPHSSTPARFGQVVWNPFEDIVPRNKMAAHNAVLFDGEVDDPRKKKKKNLVCARTRRGVGRVLILWSEPVL